MRRFICTLSLAALCGLLAALPAQSQSAQSIVDDMVERYQEQLEGIDNYVVETNFSTTYYKKTTGEDGLVRLQTHTELKGMEGMSDNMMDAGSFTNPDELRRLAEAAEYRGTEEVGGRTVYALYVPDASVMAPEGSDEGPEGEMTIYIDQERLIPLRMEMTAQGDDGETFHPTVSMEDYQQHEGLWIPHMMVMEVSDLDSALTPEEREEARQQLDQMEKQLAEMPEAQRKMVEGLMKDQLDNLRQALETGTFTFTIEVTDVRVNTDLPEGLFDDEGE